MKVSYAIDFYVLGNMIYLDFQKFQETWFGQWSKEGLEYPFFNKVDLLKCSFCLQDYINRRNNMLFIYRVPGISKAEDCYDWSRISCRNPSGCWGPNKRFWTISKGYSSTQWVFKSSIALDSDGHHSFLDELRVDLQQGRGSNRLEYSGVCHGRQCIQFFPWLRSASIHPVRKVLIKVISGEPIPCNKQWHEKLVYMYPNHIQFRFFEPPVMEVELPYLTGPAKDPLTEENLEQHWNEIRNLQKV